MRTQLSCFALATALFCPAASAQWVQTNGPYGGVIFSFAVSGTNLFAGTAGGIFLSTNNGTSWINSGMPGTIVRSLAAEGTSLYALASGIQLSTNGGESWNAVNTPENTLSFATIGETFLAGCTNGFIYRSTNGGTDWAQVPSAGVCCDVTTFAVSGTNVLVGGGLGAGLSPDSGRSWIPIDFGVTNLSINAFAKRGAKLFAGGSGGSWGGGGVFLSTDNGASWTAFNNGLTNADVRCLAVLGSFLLAGTSGGIFLTTDTSANWTPVSNGLTNACVSCLAISGPNLLAGTCGGGVFLSADGATSWRPANTGLTCTLVDAFGVCGSKLFAGSEMSGDFLSTDGGESWAPVTLGIPVGQFVSIGRNFFGVTGNGVYRSTDYGIDWIQAGLTNMHVSALSVAGSTLFAGTSNGVFCSKDSGASWIAASAGLPDSSFVSALAVNGTSLVACAWPQKGVQRPCGVYLSSNGGSTWTRADTAGPRNPISSFTVSGTALLAITEYYGTFPKLSSGPRGNPTLGPDPAIASASSSGGRGGIYRSSDNGITWTYIGFGSPGGVHGLVSSEKNLFAGVPGNGIFHSTDDGTSWTPVSTGLTDLNVTSLAIFGTDLMCGTWGSGVWRRPLSEMITSTQSPLTQVVAQFELCQNYPNPFNPSTIIRYQLPVVSSVKLVVYDLLGREVAELVNERKIAGTYEVKFNGPGFASGVYFYRLQAGDVVLTKKLAYLR